MGSLEVKILKPGNSELVTLDVSREADAVEVFRGLGAGGWIVVKDIMDVNSKTTVDDIRSNEVRFSLLSQAISDVSVRLSKQSFVLHKEAASIV
jgi:hypothetical protein